MFKTPTFVAVLTLALIGAAETHAKNVVQSVSITQRNPLPVIEVAANQSGYTRVTDSSIDYRVRPSGTCKPGSTLLRLTAYPERHYGGPELESVHHTFAHPQPPNAAAILELPLSLNSQEKNLAIQACANHLTLQMASGKSKQDVLSRSHLIDGPTLLRARANAGCIRPSNLEIDSKNSAWRNLAAKVRCAKAPFVGPGSVTDKPRPPLPPGPGNLQNEFAVTKIPLWMTPKKQSGKCPIHLSMNGEIHVNGPGTVRYRLRHNGVTSGIRTLEFDRAGAKNIHYSHTVHGPDQPAGSSGGIGGLASNQSDDEASGFFRVLIESPSRGMKSRPAFYEVTCETDDSPPLTTKRPDLEPATLQLVASRGAEPYEMRVKVHNRGAAASTATAVKLLYWIGPDPAFAMISIPALGVNKTHSVKLPLSNKPTKIGAHVDPDDLVNESNEANNTATDTP